MIRRTEEDLFRIVHRSPDQFTPDHEKLTCLLDVHAPVFDRYVVTAPPDDGPAPESIRREWTGLNLPVRAEGRYPIEVPVLAFEAIDVLKSAGRFAAYAWWREYYIGQKPANIEAEGYPEFLSNVDVMIFSQRYGRLAGLEV